MSTVKGAVAASWLAANTVILGTPLLATAALRAITPHRGLRTGFDRCMDRFIDLWVWNNRAMMRLLAVTRIDASWRLAAPLHRDGWYLVVSNHQGWSDILLLQELLLGRIPPLKFFVKRELIWIPVVGIAMWVLNFPFLRRYPRERLARNPALRARDREATLRACEHLSRYPSSVLNFVEGTRFTREKQLDQASPYRHLLKPKPGGVAYTLQGLGDRIEQVIDVTLLYPDGVPTFWAFLCGRAPFVMADIRGHTVTGNLTEAAARFEEGGNAVLAQWLGELWQAKDDLIRERLARN